MDKDPLRQFARWYRDAERNPRIKLPDAVCLSTVDGNGDPQGRMVLLKGFDERGFTFYTNLKSPKSAELRKTPRASLTFYWEPLRRQVRVFGDVEPVSNEEADAYFATRARLSRIGAWISDQSRPLANRLTLVRRFLSALKRFGAGPIPRPDFWSGYRVRPGRIEFWVEKPNRLHDRFLYIRKGKGWEISRLYP